MIDRAEGTGLTVALIGHVALFGVLSVGFLATPNPLKLRPTPIEVALVDQVSLESTAPNPTSEEPAAKLSPVEAPVEPDSAPPASAPNPQPLAKPQPAMPKPAPAPDAAKPAPKTPPKAAPAAAPARPSSRPVAPTGRLDGLLNGINDKPTPSKSVTPPAATAGPEARSALRAELARKLRPHWRSPTGADVDKLRTEVRVALDEKGNIVSIGECKQKGEVTPSNQPQVDLHCENAKRAIRLAAPFNTFPPEYYSVWKVIFPVFDRNLK